MSLKDWIIERWYGLFPPSGKGFEFRDSGPVIPTVRIVGLTQPIIEGINTAEELVSFAARVSNPANQLNMDTAAKLLAYCIRNEHWSVFETVSITIEVHTTRDIARQMLRHKSFSFQEFSQRYADPTWMKFKTREARLQDKKNRQNSITTTNAKLIEEWNRRQKKLAAACLDEYQWAVDNDIAKEVARSVLPEGMTISHLYMQGTLRSWIHYCQLRMGNGTQKEHREVASLCWEALRKHFPNVCEAVELENKESV